MGSLYVPDTLFLEDSQLLGLELSFPHFDVFGLLVVPVAEVYAWFARSANPVLSL
jgi:hypothetical protein